MTRRLLLILAFASGATVAAQSPDAPGGGFDRAVERLLPRVVKLYGVGAGKQAGYGSGVLVSEDGLVVTVYSLLINARELKVVDADGVSYGADVVHRDRARQLALLKMTPTIKPDSSPEASDASSNAISFPHFDLACAGVGGRRAFLDELLLPGDWIVSAGNAFNVAVGAEPVSLAHGVYSARTRLDATRRVKDFVYEGDVLVFDAITSNPGAPGGAVVNLDGVFVGMVGRQVASNLTRTHFNYAMPRDVICAFLLEATGERTPESTQSAIASQRAESGIRLTKTGYQTVLPFVERVKRKSPADRAGVRQDDLILSVNGHNVGNVDECQKRLDAVTLGESISLVIRRDREIVTVLIETEAP